MKDKLNKIMLIINYFFSVMSLTLLFALLYTSILREQVEYNGLGYFFLHNLWFAYFSIINLIICEILLKKTMGKLVKIYLIISSIFSFIGAIIVLFYLLVDVLF